MRDRSMTRPSSTVPKPGALCPPLRTAMSRCWSRPKPTAAMTSATSCGPDDQRRTLVDHPVLDATGVVIAGILVADDVAAECRLEALRARSRRCAAVVWFRWSLVPPSPWVGCVTRADSLADRSEIVRPEGVRAFVAAIGQTAAERSSRSSASIASADRSPVGQAIEDVAQLVRGRVRCGGRG